MSVILQRLSVAACIAATSFVLSASTVHAQGALNSEARSFQTFICDSEADLQTQILSANDGKTIFPGGGTCEGPFVISERDVNIRGFGSTRSTLTAAPGSSCVLTIEFARVKISRIDIDATGADHGICVGTGGSVRLFDDVEIKNSSNIGLFLSKGASAEITDSTVKENLGVGIGVSSGAHATVEHNEIRDNGAEGVRVNGSASAELAANEITGNSGAGVLVDLNSAINLNEASYEDDPEFGVIENNLGGGVSCGFSGALIVGAVQNFGAGNPPSDNVVLETGCHVVNNPP